MTEKERRGDPVILSGYISEYRFLSTQSKTVGTNRRKLTNVHVKRKVKVMTARYKPNVENFFERSCYSTTLPGIKR